MIYLDLVASTAQLLPYLQVAESEAEGRGGSTEGAALGSTGAVVVRLVSRLMQVNTGMFTPVAFSRFNVTACCGRRQKIGESRTLVQGYIMFLGLPATRARLFASVADTLKVSYFVTFPATHHFPLFRCVLPYAVLHGLHRYLFRDRSGNVAGRFPREVLPAPGLCGRSLGGLCVPLPGDGRQGKRSEFSVLMRR